jgi:outer membrane protein TolC
MRKLLGGLLLALQTTLALGQAKTTPASNWQSVFFDSPTTALPLLTTAAIQHSSQLKAMEIDKSISQEDMKLVKKNLWDAVSLGGTYSYGNLASVALADPGNQGQPQFNTYNSSRYTAGVSVGLPLGQIAGRGNRIRKEALNFQRMESVRQEQENAIRQQVIQLYQNVLLARKMLTLRQEAYVTVQTNYQLAEKQFRLGQITLPALSAVSTQVTEQAVAQETIRNQYDTAFMILEEVVGTKISSLMTPR